MYQRVHSACPGTTGPQPGRRAEARTPCSSPGRPCSMLLSIKTLLNKPPSTCEKNSYFKNLDNDSQSDIRKTQGPQTAPEYTILRRITGSAGQMINPPTKCHYSALGSPSSRRQPCMQCTRP